MDKTTAFRIIKVDRMIDGTGKAIMPKAEILMKSPRSGHKDHSQSQVTHLLKRQIMAIAQYYLGS